MHRAILFFILGLLVVPIVAGASETQFVFLEPRSTRPFVERFLDASSGVLLSYLGRAADFTHASYQQFQEQQRVNPVHRIIYRAWVYL